MTASDYMKIISSYIIDKVENNTDMTSVNFNFKSVSENENLFYSIEELDEQRNLRFFLKFPCKNKADFFGALNSMLVQYFKENDLLCYSAMNVKGGQKEKFIMSTYSGVNINLDINDFVDEAMYSEFKEYLDEEVQEELTETTVVLAKSVKMASYQGV